MFISTSPVPDRRSGKNDLISYVPLELPAGQTRAAGIFSNLYSKENRQIVCLVPSGKFCRYFMLSNSTPEVITVFPASDIYLIFCTQFLSCGGRKCPTLGESGEAVPGKRDRGVCTRKSPGTLQKSPPALGGYPGAFLLPFSFLNSLQVQRRRIIIAFYHRERLQGHQFFTRGSFVISNDPWRVVGLKRTHPTPMYSENKY